MTPSRLSRPQLSLLSVSWPQARMRQTAAAATAVARIFAGIIWLIGLAAVVFLWQKDSSGFFKARCRGGGI